MGVNPREDDRQEKLFGETAAQASRGCRDQREGKARYWKSSTRKGDCSREKQTTGVTTTHDEMKEHKWVKSERERKKPP